MQRFWQLNLSSGDGMCSTSSPLSTSGLQAAASRRAAAARRGRAADTRSQHEALRAVQCPHTADMCCRLRNMTRVVHDSHISMLHSDMLTHVMITPPWPRGLSETPFLLFCLQWRRCLMKHEQDTGHVHCFDLGRQVARHREA